MVIKSEESITDLLENGRAKKINSTIARRNADATGAEKLKRDGEVDGDAGHHAPGTSPRRI